MHTTRSTQVNTGKLNADLVPADQLPFGTRVRLGVIRTVAVGLVATGAFVALADAASAKPPVPAIDVDDLSIGTVPPWTVPPTLPPVVTIPPIIVDPGTPTTVPPTVPPTIPPVIVNPTTTVKPPVPTIPPVIVNPTIPPTTVAPDPTEPTDPTDPVDPVDPVDPTVPTEVEGATETAAGPDTLAVTGNNSTLPIVGASLLGAGALIAGGVAFDKRRRARG